jgi:hypothetical protein
VQLLAVLAREHRPLDLLLLAHLLSLGPWHAARSREEERTQLSDLEKRRLALSRMRNT